MMFGGLAIAGGAVNGHWEWDGAGPSLSRATFVEWSRTDIGDIDGDADFVRGELGVVEVVRSNSGATISVAALYAPSTSRPPAGRGVSDILLNHDHQLATTAPATIGNPLPVSIYSGPGYAAPANVGLTVSLGLVPQPFPVAGFLGMVELNPAASELVYFVANSSIGHNQTFLSIPSDPGLVGTTMLLQAAVLPTVAGPLSVFTNAVRETVQ